MGRELWIFVDVLFRCILFRQLIIDVMPEKRVKDNSRVWSAQYGTICSMLQSVGLSLK